MTLIESFQVQEPERLEKSLSREVQTPKPTRFAFRKHDTCVATRFSDMYKMRKRSESLALIVQVILTAQKEF